jgi:Family of unknown function (DUF6879)
MTTWGRLAYDEFKALLLASRRAWHLELRDTYNVRSEDEPFGRFLNEEPDRYEWLEEWLTFIRKATAAGVTVQRARIVTVPHVDYTRFGLVVAPHNIEAGEDIRYLPRHLSEDIDFPKEDFWLFDDDTLVLSVFSADGRTAWFERASDPDLTAQCRAVRDQVWSRAIPFAEYVH